SLNQALLPNANFKFCVFVGSPQACSSSTVWVAGAVVIVDTNGNNVYDTGEQVVAGSAPTVGTTGFKADPKIKFIDSNANNVYDFGETVVYDNGNTGLWSSVANDPYIGPAVFGFQFGMTYDPTFLIPQMDPCLAASALGCPAASTSPDGAGSTVLLGGTSTNCPIYQRLSGASGGCNFAASVAANTGSLAISATAGKMLIGFTYLAPRNGTFINAATLLGNIAFEILKSGSTTISLSATDLKFVDINANVIPFYALGVQVTDTITIGNNPPVASFTFTHLAAGDTSCAAITGSNCGTLAFRFDGSASVASGTATIANPTGYFWDFGDNTQDSSSAAANLCAEPTAFTYLTCNQGPTAIHDYNATVGGGGPGTWDATLRIVDSNAATGSARDNTGTVILNVQPSHIDHMVIAQPPANPTTTVVSCNPSTVAFGASTTCTATVTDTSATPTTPTGTVTFTSSGTGTFTGSPCTLSAGTTAGTATCFATYAPTGTVARTDTITASYSGDAGHSTSSGTFSLSVTTGTHSTTTTVSCPTTVFVNQGVTCTATVTDSTAPVTTPTGSVTFTVSGVTGTFTTCTLAAGTTAGTATCNTTFTPSTTGTASIVGTYGGD
ncbi:MAG TPA: Ig-like domain repeat protein, partial [Ktedonobacteraceae bacterium]|nr:Ig-like domain repeat protein [Ktedonobacteraceae bacterium]